MAHGLDLLNATAELYAAELEEETKVEKANKAERLAKLRAIVELSQHPGWHVYSAMLGEITNTLLQKSQSANNAHECAMNLGGVKLGLALRAWVDGQLATAKAELGVKK